MAWAEEWVGAGFFNAKIAKGAKNQEEPDRGGAIFAIFALKRSISALGGEGGVEVGDEVEDGVEAGDLEEVAEGRAEVGDEEAAAVLALFLFGLEEDTEAGAGDVFDLGEIEGDGGGAGREAREEVGLEEVGAGVVEFAGEGENGPGAAGGGSDLHGLMSRERGAGSKERKQRTGWRARGGYVWVTAAGLASAC